MKKLHSNEKSSFLTFGYDKLRPKYINWLNFEIKVTDEAYRPRLCNLLENNLKQ